MDYRKKLVPTSSNLSSLEELGGTQEVRLLGPSGSVGGGSTRSRPSHRLHSGHPSWAAEASARASNLLFSIWRWIFRL